MGIIVSSSLRLPGGHDAGIVRSSGTPVIGNIPSAFVVPAGLLEKLQPVNRTGLGSTTVGGNVITTQWESRSILSVVNTYLQEPLTAAELEFILRHRTHFVFTAGMGDRREDYYWRFGMITNWHGEDTKNLLMQPWVYASEHYNFRLTFDGKNGQMTLTDTHYGDDNTWGSLRYLTVEVK
ncbi:hypothetical protein QUQ58_002262 [Escherichia coli]|nr:hypothetical protein [Escherichia coli]